MSGFDGGDGGPAAGPPRYAGGFTGPVQPPNVVAPSVAVGPGNHGAQRGAPKRRGRARALGILAFVVVGAGFFALAASGGDDGGGTQKTEAAGKQSLFERRVARHCGDDRSFVEGGVPHLPAPEPGATGRFIAFGGTLHGYDEIGTDTRTSSAITAEKEANIVFVYCTASDGTRVIPMDCQWQDRHGNVTQTSKVLLNRRAFSLYEARSGALLAEGSFEANVPDRCPHSAIGNESSTADPSVDVGIAEQEKAWMDAHLGTGVYVP